MYTFEVIILRSLFISEQYRNAPFTPFSVTLGYMIKEIHRCLMLALTTEQSPIATTQVIKVYSQQLYFSISCHEPCQFCVYTE